MAGPSGSSSAASANHQKRVLPPRPRRGGTGVGNCDADVLILDTRERQAENRPLIPAETFFLLTTNSSLVSAASSSTTSELELNNHIKERYFDRPEVLKAFKEQQIIQTPQFQPLSEVSKVGGRFRPRGSEDEGADTSDAAYEKRHRKYETFEKRQRLREKEKLKHEQYKLKERIEQLRAMDAAAFLLLPASSFSPAPGLPSEDVGDDSSLSLPSIHVNGTAAQNEGERRKKEMLDIAVMLEERYRTLLPPDNKGGDRRRQDFSTSLEPENAVVPDDESDLERDVIMPPSKNEMERLKLKIKFPLKQKVSSNHYSPGDNINASLKESALTIPTPSDTLALRRRFKTLPPSVPSNQPHSPGRQLDHKTRSSSQSFGMPLSDSVLTGGTDMSAVNPDVVEAHIDASLTTPDNRPRKRMKSVGDEEHERFTEDLGQEPISAPSNNLSSHQQSKPRASHSTAAFKAEQTSSVLVVTAVRSSEPDKSRKTQRSVTAFGSKIPSALDAIFDYELPEWVSGNPDCDGEVVGDEDHDECAASSAGVVEDEILINSDIAEDVT